ncbi:MAG: DUF2254 domain-containing protein [Alphaproteobacteria bacterium]|nr:DUF2254 domain-containing protein [Alphaproteobacteria bacterium]
MYSSLSLYIRRLGRSMWVRASAFSLLAVAAAFASIFLEPYIPYGISTSMSVNAVDDILTIIASSMLTVTTFSLGIAVSAFNWAASSATPRATTLLVEDATTQNVLSTFLGAFLYSLIALVVLRTGAYGEDGRVVLFLVTVIVVIVIVATLLRWIAHLTQIGRMGDMLDRVEEASLRSVDARLRAPFLSCQPLPDGYRLPRGNHEIFATTIGYLQHIDVAALNEVAGDLDTRFAIRALPGTFIEPTRPLIESERDLSSDEIGRVTSCCTFGKNRTFEQDPRFGVIVLAEIASRALSPAINDPGTAISVITRLFRILHRWSEGAAAEDAHEVRYPLVYAPKLRMADLFDDAFTSIARDSAGMVEVSIRLQKTLAALAKMGPDEFREEAKRHADLSFARASTGLKLRDDLEVVKSARAGRVAS